MTTSPPPDRLDRIEAIVELLATETLANAQAVAANARAIAELTESLAAQKRTVDYLISKDGSS